MEGDVSNERAIISGECIAVTDAVVFRQIADACGIAAKFREKSIFIRRDDWDHSERRESVKSLTVPQQVANSPKSMPFIVV